MYNLLFHTAWSVLSDFGKDKKWIGGRIGATAILHIPQSGTGYGDKIFIIIRTFISLCQQGHYCKMASGNTPETEVSICLM